MRKNGCVKKYKKYLLINLYHKLRLAYLFQKVWKKKFLHIIFCKLCSNTFETLWLPYSTLLKARYARECTLLRCFHGTFCSIFSSRFPASNAVPCYIGKVSTLPSHQLLWFLASIYLYPGFEPLISQRWVRVPLGHRVGCYIVEVLWFATLVIWF